MVEQSILKYVKDSLAKGMPLTQIKKNLRASGWSDKDINEAVNFAGSKQTEKTPGVAPPKNIWIFIGIFAVVAVIAAIVLIFFFIGGEEEGEISPTCYEEGGYVCSSGETCEENYLEASDTARCCPEICVPVCVEDWECTNWTECISHSQTRNCTELSNCGTIYDKPLPFETKVCGLQNYTNVSCVAGDGCNLTCVDFGGDPDCSCMELNNATIQNITLCGEGEACNGTTLNSSDTGVCCLGDCITPTCEGDGFCKLGCQEDGGDRDCTCSEQGGELGYHSVEACISAGGSTIWSSDFIEGLDYCCWIAPPSCIDDGVCDLGCPYGDRDCTCAEQGGVLCLGKDVPTACKGGSAMKSSDYILGVKYCCKEGCASQYPWLD